MPRSPTITICCRANGSGPPRSQERARVGGVAGKDPHRDRPTLGVGQQPVLDLGLPFFPSRE